MPSLIPNSSASPARPSPAQAFIFRAVCGLLLAAAAREVRPAELPPGVAEMERLPAPRALPEGVLAAALEVDWTHPRLRAELVLGAREAGDVPRLMQDVAQSRAGALLVQLAEPVEEGGRWGLALEAAPAEEPERPAFRGGRAVLYPEATASVIGGDRVAIGGAVPWLPQGPGLGENFEPESALANGAAAVGVRWLGLASDWRSRPPEDELKSRAILTALDPATGRGAIVWLARNSGDRIELKSLADWIEAAFSPRTWIALHSMGRQASARAGDWALGEAQPGARERAGAVLVLRAAGPEDDFDWAREPGARIHASSFETGHAPDRVASGRLWPSHFAPNVWMSRAGEHSREKPWIEIEFDRPRPVERIRIVYPFAAGWSADFNPARLLVRFEGASSLDRAEPIEIEGGNREMVEIALREPAVARRVRIEVAEPTQFNLPAPARLAGIQLWGPPPRDR